MGFLDRLFGGKKVPAEPAKMDTAPLRDAILQILKPHERPASLLVADPEYKPEDPRASWLGAVRVGRPGEPWPVYKNQPMAGICQINLDEAPFVPDSLKDLRLLALFMARGDKKWPIDFPVEGQAHGTNWLIRAYAALDGLVPYPDAPPPPRGIQPCAARYRLITDMHPAPDELEEMIPLRERHSSEVIDPLLESIIDSAHESEDTYGSKIGGWPATIQDPIARPLAFQLGCEDHVGLHWIDGGCAYFWRDPAQEWTVEIQFY